MGSQTIPVKVLLLGANGQLGFELKQQLSNNVVLQAYDRSRLDVTDFAALIQIIQNFKPTIIINATAYTAVDKAELEPELAFLMNEALVKVLAQEAKKYNACLIHYSTDYVFDGVSINPYTEDDMPNPINVYGKSKLAGELAIQASGCQYFIFRISWLIGEHGHNFVKTILKLVQTRTSLSVVNDQYGAPTTTSLVASLTLKMINRLANQTIRTNEVYHLAPKGKTTWFDMARFTMSIAEQHALPLSMSINNLSKVVSTEYQTLAKRPLNSQLNSAKLERDLNIILPGWHTQFEEVVNQIALSYRK